jgi:hypothetical protein
MQQLKRKLSDVKKDVVGIVNTKIKKGKIDTKILCNLNNDLISSTEWKKIEDRCRKNEYSISGFLSDDDNLREVIDNDSKFLKTIGLTHEQIAKRLKEVTDKYQNLEKKRINSLPMGTRYSRDSFHMFEGLKVSCVAYRGFQECPFENSDYESDDSCRGSKDYTITNIKTGDSISFSELLIHLISVHYFFEGCVKHRLAPIEIIDVLEIACPSQQSKTSTD